MASIEDDVRTLASKVAGVAADEARKDPAFARGITSVLEAARARAAAAKPDAGLREELAAVRQTLKAQSASLADLLESRRARREQLGLSSGKTLEQVCDALEAGMGQLSARVARLEAQVQGKVRPGPVPVPVPVPPDFVRTGRRTPPIMPIAAGASLVVLAAVLAIRFWPAGQHTDVISQTPPPGPVQPPGPVPHDLWQTLWGQALRQTAQCQERPDARTLLQCLCPDLKLTAGADPAPRCPLRADWAPPLKVAALQAVLNIRQGNVWVDERLGLLAEPLQQLANTCALPDEVEVARRRLAAGTAEDAVTREAGDAALALLEHVRKDPSCAG